MLLHKNSGALDGLRRVRGQKVNVLMAEESGKKRFNMFQRGS